MSSTRQLAAIMFTDIVGYTALMGRDEKKAFEILKKNREIQKPLIEKFHGRWIKELGDGVMASFHTVTDAVFCAAAIHQATQNVDDLKLRIGIHLGEVVFEDNDVFGDGVNIASRLQALASVGSTWVSETVHKNLTNKKEVTSEFIKEEYLKNVSEPVKVYEISVKEIPGYLPDDINAYKKDQPAEKKARTKKSRLLLISILTSIVIIATIAVYLIFKKAPLKSPAESGLAILPFTNNSGRADLDFLSVGMASEIRTKLSMSKHFGFISALQATLPYQKLTKTTREIGNELGIDYLLSGVYQANGNKIRIDAEFLDAKTGKLIWNMQLEKELSDFFSMQTAIADEVLRRFSFKEATIGLGGTKNIEALAAYTKGVELYEYFEETTNLKAIQEFEKAISLDSNFANAWLLLMDVESFVLVNEQIYDLARLDRIKKYREYIQSHFKDGRFKYHADAIYYYRCANEFDLALSALSKVLEQDPQNLDAIRLNAYIFRRKLQYESAFEWIRKWLQLKPDDYQAYLFVGQGLMQMGDAKNSLKAGLKAWEKVKSRDLAYEIIGRALANNSPLEQLPDDLKSKTGFMIELNEAKQEADWNRYLKIAIKEKNEWQMSFAYFMLEKTDSATYWASEGVKKFPHDQILWAIMGQREKAISELSSKWTPIIKSGDDLMSICNMSIDEIIVYAILGDNTEATRKLKQMNEKYPDWGNYFVFFRHDFTDIIKKKYPSFQQAIDSLKIKPFIDINKYIKL